MINILRSTIIALAIIGLLVGGTGAVAAGHHNPGRSPACDDLEQADDQSDSHADDGLDRAQEENNCDRSIPVPDPVE